MHDVEPERLDVAGRVDTFEPGSLAGLLGLVLQLLVQQFEVEALEVPGQRVPFRPGEPEPLADDVVG
jgi:hypothetical protein